MSNRVRKELGKLRELLWWFLAHPRPSGKCYFCKKTVLTQDHLDLLHSGWVRFGNATAPSLLDLDVTLHHIDGDHSNNDPLNLAPAHGRKCHKNHHAKLVFKTWRKKVAGSLVAAERAA